MQEAVSWTGRRLSITILTQKLSTVDWGRFNAWAWRHTDGGDDKLYNWCLNLHTNVQDDSTREFNGEWRLASCTVGGAFSALLYKKLLPGQCTIPMATCRGHR